MQIPTHILSGWCVADLVELTPRERVFAMVAASFPDVDGLGLVVSLDYYGKYHHVLAHNVLVATVLAGFLAAFSSHRGKGFLLYFSLFHLHLLLDLLGSGAGWGIDYFWPFSNREISTRFGWELNSWQNAVALLIALAWTAWIAQKRGRTPFERLFPTLDRELLRLPKSEA